MDSEASNGFSFGDTLTYRCKDGFDELTDSQSEITCLNTGEWETPPTCTGEDYFNIPLLSAAIKTNSTNFSLAIIPAIISSKPLTLCLVSV